MGCSPPPGWGWGWDERRGAGRSRRRGCGRAWRSPRSGSVRQDRRPLLPHSSGRGKFSRSEGLSPGASAWGFAGGGCQDPPGMGAQPRGMPLSWGVAGQGLPHFRGGLGTDSHAKPSACWLGWCGAGAPKGEDWGVAAGGRGGGPRPAGWLGAAIPVSPAGLHSQPCQAGPVPTPASCWLHCWPQALKLSHRGGPAPTAPQGSDAGCLPAVWLTTQNHSTLVTERSAVPFLPVNPEYSATRNQVRFSQAP